VLPLDNPLMTLGSRIEERRKSLGISQAELARRVGVRQSTMNSLINGDSRSSRSIVQIAHELQTTPAYLTGVTDDPDAGAPAPPSAPTLQHVMLPVALPSENALARMFEGLLELVDQSAPPAELARELAQLLPTGLSQLKGRLIEREMLPRRLRSEPLQTVASEDREPPQ